MWCCAIFVFDTMSQALEFAELLITMVQQHPCLFDPKNKQYKDSVMRSKIWMEIGAALGCDPSTCQQKWKNIRDTYVRKKREVVKPSSGASRDSGAPNAGRWPLFPMLGFLDDSLSSPPTASSIPVSAIEEAFDHPLIIRSGPAPSTSSGAASVDMGQPGTSTGTGTYAPTTKNKKRARDPVEEAILSQLEKERQARDYTSDELFLLSFAEGMGKMDQKKKDFFKVKLQTLYYETMYND